MSGSNSPRIFRLDPVLGPFGRRIWRQVAGPGAEIIVVAGGDGGEVPARLTDPRIDRDPGSSSRVWKLVAAEGEFHFHARSVDRLEQCPGLFEPLHRRFALTVTDRIAVRILLWLLRLPGGARLLRSWHSRRH